MSLRADVADCFIYSFFLCHVSNEAQSTAAVAAAGDTSTVGGRTTWRTTITGTFASFKHRCDTLPSNNLMAPPRSVHA